MYKRQPEASGSPRARVLGLPASAQPKLRERFLRLLCAASGALLEDDDCLVRVAVEHAYEGARGRVRVEVANASSSAIRDLRVDVFADDGRDAGEAPKLSVVITTDGGGAAELAPGARVVARVSATCRSGYLFFDGEFCILYLL